MRAVYPIVWLDAIFLKICEDGQVRRKDIYTGLGLGLDGKKDILGLYFADNEWVNFCLQILKDLSSRGSMTS